MNFGRPECEGHEEWVSVTASPRRERPKTGKTRTASAARITSDKRSAVQSLSESESEDIPKWTASQSPRNAKVRFFSSGGRESPLGQAQATTQSPSAVMGSSSCASLDKRERKNYIQSRLRRRITMAGGILTMNVKITKFGTTYAVFAPPLNRRSEAAARRRPPLSPAEVAGEPSSSPLAPLHSNPQPIPAFTYP